MEGKIECYLVEGYILFYFSLKSTSNQVPLSKTHEVFFF